MKGTRKRRTHARTPVEALEGLLGGHLAGADGADLEEAVDGAVEEGVPHVDDDVDLGRPEGPREAAAGHPGLALPSWHWQWQWQVGHAFLRPSERWMPWRG